MSDWAFVVVEFATAAAGIFIVAVVVAIAFEYGRREP